MSSQLFLQVTKSFRLLRSTSDYSFLISNILCGPAWTLNIGISVGKSFFSVMCDCWRITLKSLVDFFQFTQSFQMLSFTSNYSFLTSTILCDPARTLNTEVSVGKSFFSELRDCWKIALKCLVNFFAMNTIVPFALFHFWLFFSDIEHLVWSYHNTQHRNKRW